SLELRIEGEAQGLFDVRRVGRVICNLVTNAPQHGTPSGPVQVVLRGAPDAVELSVHNQGAPIAPERLTSLFAPTRAGSGPGARSVSLGLYISREIALAHGGSIEARSLAGEGTTFTVRLPKRPPA